MNVPAHYISDARKQFESEIKEPLNRYGLILSDGKENLSLHYKSKMQDESFLKLSENKLAIDESLAGRILEYTKMKSTFLSMTNSSGILVHRDN